MYLDNDSQISEIAPFFPHELFERILELSGDDRTLEATSLVNRVFSDISQKYLFRYICIGPPNGPEFTTAQKFSSLIKSNPRIGAYVWHLKVDYSQDYHSTCWISDDESMVHILPSLKGLIHLTLYGKPLLHWDSFSASFQSALGSALGSPLLRSIDIRGIVHFPLGIIQAPSVKQFSCISTLWLQDDHLGSYDESTLAENSSDDRPILESLTVNDLYMINCTHLSSSFNLDHLVEFNFSTRHFGKHDDFAHILQASGHSLETVIVHLENSGVPSIFIPDDGNIFPAVYVMPLIDLSPLCRMKTLVIETNVTVSFGCGLNSRIPWLIQCLQSLPGPASSFLSEFILNIDFIIMEDILPEVSFSQISWENLVAILLSEKLSRIHQVHLNVSDDGKLLSPHLMDILQQDPDLSKLRDKGLLSLTNAVSSLEKNLTFVS